jgi:DNA-binding transcriptional regulator YdaS (Cro superfamily)
MGDAATLHSHAIRKAAAVLGGEEELAARLGLAVGTVRMMMTGRLGVPQRVFLQVIDIISAEDAPIVHPSALGETSERRDD